MSSNLPMVSATAPLSVSQALPDFLKNIQGHGTGLENLQKEDFKIPELKLIQGTTPELDANPGKAIKNQYWHTGLNINLGDKVRSVVALSKKTIVLFRPMTDQGGGILAKSNDCIHWDTGGNRQFTVKLKDVAEPVIWDTKGSVQESGLAMFGSSNPRVPDSVPAATTFYEYLLYLPDFDGASPVVHRLKSTGLDNGKALNSFFAIHAHTNKIPCYAHVVEWTPQAESGNGGVWTNSKPTPNGFVDEATFNLVAEINKNFASKLAEMDIAQEDDSSTTTLKEDKIPF